MLQIPVEGGHRGADLIVRHGLETAQLDRSRDNGHLLYLSASFIDCAHKISPITEGCSVVLTYQLVWNTETRVTVPRGICFPTFFSSLNTVKQILSPFKSPTEDFDTEMLVLPLANDYARIPLSYSNLKGSDQLMASLLQSSNLLEVRLATIVNYRAGTAYHGRRISTERAENDGSDSPPQLKQEKLAPSSKRRTMSKIIENNCSIKEFFQLSGRKDANKDSISLPIIWSRDYIFNNIESVEDLFDQVSSPDKEEYDRYHTPADGLELKQWWYKPVLIAYPQDSVAIKCRKNFYAVVTDLNKIIAISKTEHQQSNLLQLRKIINFLYRQKQIEDEYKECLEMLLEICIKLEAKEEGLHVFRYFAQCSEFYWFEIHHLIASFIGLAGWSACLESLTTIFTYDVDDPNLSFKVDLMWELLEEDSELRNEAAAAIFRLLFATLFNSEEIPTDDNFVNRMHWLLGSHQANVSFFVSIFILERRHLLNKTEQLLPLVTEFIVATPDISFDFLNEFVDMLFSSSLVSAYSIQQMHELMQQLLVELCKRFIHCNWSLTANSTDISSWIQLPLCLSVMVSLFNSWWTKCVPTLLP